MVASDSDEHHRKWTPRCKREQDYLREEEALFKAGMSQRTSRPKRSNSHARSRARRLGLKPVT